MGRRQKVRKESGQLPERVSVTGGVDRTIVRPEIDPRAASAIIRGYEYQVYRSVVEWLKLEADQELYLERGEDLELRGPEGIRHDQIKDRRSPISLGRADVLASLGHFWKRRLPGSRATFRFISTGALAVERRDPFGAGIPGIELWRKAAIRPANEAIREICLLRDYLVDREKLDNSLRAYLLTASPEQIHRELITPFDWITNEPQADAVEAQAKALLGEIGFTTYHLPRAHSAQLFPQFVKQAFAIAARDPQRPLKRVDTLAIFESYAIRTMSAAEFRDELREAVGDLIAPTEGRTFLVARGTHIAPPLTGRYVRRPQIYNATKAALERSGAAILVGSAGAGKSAVAKDIAADAVHGWRWANLRDVRGDELATGLEHVEMDVLGHPEIRQLAIDDIDLTDASPRVSDSLARITASLRQRGGQLLLTSSNEPSPNNYMALEISDAEVIWLPPYSEIEIASLLQPYAQDEKALGTAAQVLLMVTSGNPALIVAWLRFFEHSGFSIDSLMATEKPAEIADVERQARAAIRLLPQDARELLYRISVSIVPVERSQAIELGLFEPGITEPGIALDSIVGPWLEVMDQSGALRRSPLVSNLAIDALGSDRALRLEHNVADVLARRKTLRETDVAGVLYHGIRGSNEPAVVAVLAALLHAEEEAISSAARAASFFVRFALNDSVRGFSSEARMVIRAAQFRMATLLGRFDDARAVIQAFDEDLPPSQDNAVARFRFLGYIIAFGNQPIADRTEQALRWVTDRENTTTIADATRSKEKRRLGVAGSASMAASLVLARVRSHNDLTAFTATLRSADQGDARRFLAWLPSELFVLRGLFGTLQVAEFDRDVAQWTELANALTTFASLLTDIGLSNVAAHVVSEVARIRSDHLGDAPGAQQYLGAFVARFGPSPVVEAARALTLFSQQRHNEAYQLWNDTLLAIPATDRDIQPSTDARLAAIAASRLSRFAEAERWLVWASERLSPRFFGSIRAAYRFDAAFAAWKDRRDDDALTHLIAVLPRIGELEKSDDRFAFSVSKRIGHVIAWMSMHRDELQRSKDYYEPSVGDSSRIDDNIRRDEIPPTRFQDIVEAAAEFEFRVSKSPVIYQTYRDSLETTDAHDAPVGGNRVGIGWALRGAQFDNFVHRVVTMADAITAFMRERGKPADPAWLAGLVESIAVVGLVSALCENVSDSCIRQWASTYRVAGYDAAAQKLELALEFRDGSGQRSLAILKGLDSPQTLEQHETRIMSAVVHGTSGHATPNVLLTCVQYWIYATRLISAMLGVPDALLHCLETALTPYLIEGLHFTKPRTTVPRLRASLATADRPWRKLGAIVTALVDATSGEMPAEMSRILDQNIAEEKTLFESR